MTPAAFVEAARRVLKECAAVECSADLDAAVTHWAQGGGIALPGDVVARLKELGPVDFSGLPQPPPCSSSFSFIDLFAGIGGFRLAFQGAGGRCLFSSEWDRFAQKSYFQNFGEVPFGDIRAVDKAAIPDHDILCAGFPCQPFSLAGVSKKQSLGRSHGFADKTQGTLFFEIKEILRVKRPRAFMLENVKNLLSHDRGRTFEVIRHALVDQLGYCLQWKVVDGGNWVPQHRERIFLVGVDPQQVAVEQAEIVIPAGPEEGLCVPQLAEILQKEVEDYTIGPGTWATLQRHRAHHASRGNGFGYTLHTLPPPVGARTRTISARYHKDGAEVLIDQPGERPRRLTIEETMRLMGYDPDCFQLPVSRTQAWRQLGNSVVVPAVTACAVSLVELLRKKGAL